ncbi:calcium-binding protein [Jiella endophytica]|uniref:Calcium-binding protein n=1 Tax=Jiella endophytica TaxID=2558362 RepID=A0A4Y8RJC9_9HYPH|nr:excalibur calcium-binding domain-containing protein [Jiella endophytica]TFF22897.1 calcium-binding protein [Jiella endophytica]
MFRTAPALFAVFAVSFFLGPAPALPAPSNDDAGTLPHPSRTLDLLLAQRRTCKSVSSCEEAVWLWCGGYTRADGDHDGIPCENVCHSKREVDAIRAQIGC